MRRGLLFVAFAWCACKPDFAKRESLVDGPAILAVRAEPAEAKPGETVTFTALVASPEGEIGDAVAWTFCSTPKLLTDNTAVSPACNYGGTVVAATSPLPSSSGCRMRTP